MKRNKTLFSIGVSVLAVGTALLAAGCRPVEDSRRNDYSGGGYHYTTYYTITYDLSGCTLSDFGSFSNYKPAEQKVKEGESVTLAQAGSKSEGGETWKPEYAVHSGDEKILLGWSKTKSYPNTLDYQFGQTITPTENMALYPVFSKYCVGDKIKGKTVVYVKNGSKVKISMGSFSSSGPLEFDVTGDWMYLAVDDNAGSASQKRKWAASSISVTTSDDVGAGKSNTDAILTAYPSAAAADNAAKYCKSLGTGFLPSRGEMYLIDKAIRNGKIYGLPSYSQTDDTLGLKFAGFWSSSQESTNKSYYMNLYKTQLSQDHGYTGDKSTAFYVCPVMYFDKDGHVTP
ncbi:MAG: hypothetical protein ACTTKL_02135 [Treponema sp.]